MRTINHALLLMAVAGLVSWYVASTLMTALTRHLTQILWMLN